MQASKPTTGLTMITIGASPRSICMRGTVFWRLRSRLPDPWIRADRRLFMHLRPISGMTRIVGTAAVLWLGILSVGTTDDVLTRGWLLVPG